MSGYGAARGGSRTGGGRRGLRGAQAAAARGAASRRLEVECDEDSRRGWLRFPTGPQRAVIDRRR